MTMVMLFAAMLVIALLFVLPPLLRQPRSRAPGQNELNVLLHRKRLAELEADLANGVLNEAQAAQAREDHERELLQELADTNGITAASAAPMAGRVSALIVVILVPVLALGLYYKHGNWRGQDNAAKVSMPAETLAEGNMPPLDEVVKRLEQKLKEEPNRAEGWLMLGRSYAYTGRYTDAVRAYARAEALTAPPEAQVYAEYAEVMALANNASLAGEPEKLIEKALKLQPDNPNVLWLAGMSAFQKADYPTAVKYWESLQKTEPPDSEQGRVLASYLEQARAGKPFEPIVPLSETTTSENSALESVAASGTGATLKVHVALDPALTAQAAPEDTVFIFARAAQGPSMPLAILRKQVKDLPTDVVLDDSLAMMPSMKLSNYPEVVVGARVSRSGNAMPARGDLQSLSDAVPTRDVQAVRLLINQVVP